MHHCKTERISGYDIRVGMSMQGVSCGFQNISKVKIESPKF